MRRGYLRVAAVVVLVVLFVLVVLVVVVWMVTMRASSGRVKSITPEPHL